MASNSIFFSGINEVRLEAARLTPGQVYNHNCPIEDNSAFRTKLKASMTELFEKLMLFDGVELSITGPNVVVPLLLQTMNSKAFERLLEERALEFVICQDIPIMFSTDQKMVTAGIMGHLYTEKPDIEKIIDEGFALHEVNVSKSHQRLLKKKLIPHHHDLDRSISQEAWATTELALKYGRLSSFGLSPSDSMAGRSLAEGQIFQECCGSLMTYRYALARGAMTTFDDRVYSILEASIQRLRQADNAISRFSVIAKYEQFPELRDLCNMIDEPFDRASRFRGTYTAREFRKWLSELGPSDDPIDIVRDYVDALARRRGLFDTAPAKFLKIVSMVAIGHGLISLASYLGAEAALGAVLTGLSGSTVARITETGLEVALDFVDGYLIDSLKIGWTPKAYMRGLSRMREVGGASSS